MKTYATRLRELAQRKRRRNRLLRERQAQLAAARFCYGVARDYYDADNIAGTYYWEQEYNRCTAQAAQVQR